MQKIIIKNFKAIKDTEIEIKKVLILIGEQATGKSTIAKLIYFFKSVVIDEFWSFIFSTDEKSLSKESLIFIIQTSFFNFFGFRKEDFEITFYYDYEKDTWLKIKSESGDLIITENILSGSIEEILTSMNSLKRSLQDEPRLGNESRELELELLKKKFYLLNSIGGISTHPTRLSLFTIAGRSTTVGYSKFFETTFYADLKIKENEKILTTDEILMLEFMDNVLKLREIFRKYGGFEGLIQLAPEEKKAKLILIKEKAEKILKGKYLITGDGEKLIIDNNEKSVYLSDSSSGQQEAIRIIQDIFYNIYSEVEIVKLSLKIDRSRVVAIPKEKPVFRIIEEPEAHLFPTAQKELVELFALMVNSKEDNQLIITTHSPYILTAFNNLLFANRVVEYNSSVKDEVNNIIPSEFWLQAKDCSVYSLSRNEEYIHNCQSIFDNEKGIIQQNYLDTVSEVLGSQFNALYKIHAKAFKRK
jgi:AAA ATPase domain